MVKCLNLYSSSSLCYETSVYLEKMKGKGKVFSVNLTWASSVYICFFFCSIVRGKWGNMDGNFLTILFRYFLLTSTEVSLEGFWFLRWKFETLFTLWVGGGCCCVLGTWVCFLRLLCSVCWEQDSSVHCHGYLHSSGKLKFVCFGFQTHLCL